VWAQVSGETGESNGASLAIMWDIGMEGRFLDMPGEDDWKRKRFDEDLSIKVGKTMARIYIAL
jgi:hypothetical protein